MSRYLILVLLNLPVVLAGLINSTTSYKLKKISHRRFLIRIILWLGILTGLILAEYIYDLLFSKNLTTSEPLSLFDVVQLTAVILTFYLVNQCYVKIDTLNNKIKLLHEKISIITSDKDN